MTPPARRTRALRSRRRRAQGELPPRRRATRDAALGLGLMGGGAALAAGGMLLGALPAVLTLFVGLPLVIGGARRARAGVSALRAGPQLLPGGYVRAPSGAEVQLGRGRIVVEVVPPRGRDTVGEEARVVYERPRAAPVELLPSSVSADVALRHALAIAEEAGISLLRKGATGAVDDERPTGSWREPLLERLRRHPDALPTRVDTEAIARIAKGRDDGLSLTVPRARSVNAPVVDAFTVGALGAITVGALAGFPVAAAVGGALLAAAAGAAALLPGTRELDVDERGIVLVRRLGPFAWTTGVATDDVDGLHVVDARRPRLVGAVPGGTVDLLHASEGGLGWNDLLSARTAMIDALTRSLRAQLARAEPTPTTDMTPGVARCPRCASPLDDARGPFDERPCPGCQGRLLPSSGRERLVEGELGIDRDMLLEITQGFAGARARCPECASRMSPTRLKGASVALCTGCGALWLDAGALSMISAGRFSG